MWQIISSRDKVKISPYFKVEKCHLPKYKTWKRKKRKLSPSIICNRPPTSTASTTNPNPLPRFFRWGVFYKPAESFREEATVIEQVNVYPYTNRPPHTNHGKNTVRYPSQQIYGDLKGYHWDFRQEETAATSGGDMILVQWVKIIKL